MSTIKNRWYSEDDLKQSIAVVYDAIHTYCVKRNAAGRAALCSHKYFNPECPCCNWVIVSRYLREFQGLLQSSSDDASHRPLHPGHNP